MLTFGNHINKSKSNVTGVLKSIVGDGYYFSNKPVIQSDQTLKWNDLFSSEQADINDGTYLLSDGTQAAYLLPSTTFKTFAKWIKPTTANEEIAEFSTGETITWSSSDISISGFTSATASKIDMGGGWYFIYVVSTVDITASVLGCENSSSFGNMGFFNIYQLPNVISLSDATWLSNNPNTTASEIKEQLGITEFDYYPCSEGASDYLINVGVEISDNNIITNGTFDTDTGWVKGVGTTISGGKANFSNAGSDSLYQNCGWTSNELYLITGDLSNVSVGELRVWSGGSQSVSNDYSVLGDTDGNFSILHGTSSPSNGNIIFGSNTSFTGSLDNVATRKVIAATISGATWQTGQDTVNHTSLSNFNVTEINGDDTLLVDVGDGNDIIGNTIENKGLINFDGISSFAKYTTSDTINSVSFYYDGSVYTKNGTDYYVDGVLQGGAPTPFVYYEDGNDRILGKSDGSTFHEGEYRNLLIGDTLTTSQISLLAILLKSL